MVVLIIKYCQKRPNIENRMEVPKNVLKKFYAGRQKLGDGTLQKYHVYLNCKIY
jgi:hypothetical protein